MQSDKSKALVDSITASIETLAAMTDEAAKSETFKTWLRAVSRFHSYSFNNSLLILVQRPTAARVAGFHTWKALGRNVKKGAKGIAILAPCVSKRTEADHTTGEEKSAMKLRGFRVTHVFDIADTEGKELPELVLHSDHDGGEDLLPRLEAAAQHMGIALEYRENTGAPYGWSEGGKIVVRDTLSTIEKCGTLAHELAHEYLHWSLNRRDGLTCEQRELEAEATAYALLSQFGIEPHSENYLATWSANADTITASLQTIRGAVHHIMTAMEGGDVARVKLAA